MQHTIIPATAGSRAAFVSEDGRVWYEQVIGWILDDVDFEGAERVFRPIVHDGEIATEAIILQDSRNLARLCFDGEKLSSEEIDYYSKRVQDKLKRDAEFDEKSGVMRKQIRTALLAAHPSPLTKQELTARGVVDTDGILAPLLSSMKTVGAIEEIGGSFRLTERGVERARSAAQKEKAAHAQ